MPLPKPRLKRPSVSTCDMETRASRCRTCPFLEMTSVLQTWHSHCPERKTLGGFLTFCRLNVICRLHPWEDYMAAAQELVTKEGATPNIFLTTDDGGVIDKVSYMASRYEVGLAARAGH